MAKLLLAVMAVCLASVIADLEPGQHMLMQDMCTSLPDLSVLGKGHNLSDKEKEELLKHINNVCQIYKKYYVDTNKASLTKRGLLDGMAGLVGENSKLGMLLKAADALNKAKGVFDEVKQLAPDVHNHIQQGVKEVHDNLQDLIDSIAKEFGDKTTATTQKP